MTYDNSQFAATPYSVGRKGGTIDYSGGDVTLSTNVKGVVVVGEGNVVYRPIGETSGSITVTSAPVGFLLPHLVGLIIQSGTTATLTTVED